MPFTESFDDVSKRYLYDWVAGLSIKEIEFWHGSFAAILLEKLLISPKWEYNTIDTYKRLGIENADSLGLLLYVPRLTYQSKRPKTDMAMFRGKIIKWY